MRFLESFLAIASLVGFVFLGWWAVYQSPHSAATLEAELAGLVEAALAERHPGAKVEMDGQRAVLSGVASAADGGLSAEDAARAAAGPGGPLMGGITAVDARFGGVAAPVPEPADAGPFAWRAEKSASGRIVLSGDVPNESARDALGAFAMRLGAGPVEDRTDVADGAPEGDWLTAAQLALNELSRLDEGRAELTDTQLSLVGRSSDETVRAAASAAVANLIPPYSGAAVIDGAGLWRARHEDGALILSGLVDSEAEREEISGIARAHFDGEVRDQMAVAELDFAGWIEGVRLGLPHFAKFRSGVMAFDPGGAGFAIDGEAQGSTLAYLREDMSRLSGSYGVAIEADAVEAEVAEIADIDFEGDAAGACQSAFDAVLAGNTVEFETGSAEIDRASGETLDKLMTVAGRCDAGLRFELGGHTDNTGDRAYNLHLSEQRAQAVADYMAGAGLAAARLKAKGYGPDAPIADNATREGRAANRRLEFRIMDGSED